MPDYNLKNWQDVERAERNVALWLKERMGAAIRQHIVAAIILGPLSLLAAGAVVVGLGMFGLGIGLHLLAFPVAALAVLVAYPVQFIRWRKGLTRVSLHGGGVTVDDDRPTPAILVQGYDPYESAWNLGDILLFPATIAGMAIQHATAAVQLGRCDQALMGKVLTLLAHGGRRTTLHDIEMAIADTRLPSVLQALRQWPGVLWFVRDQVALAVNDELGTEIARQGGWRT